MSIASFVAQWGALFLALAAAALAVLWVRVRSRTAAAAEVSLPASGPVGRSLATTEALIEKRRQMRKMLSSKFAAVLDSRLVVRHLMSDRPIWVSPDEPLEDLRRKMVDRRLRHLLVCEPHDKLVGIISDRDIASRSGKTAANVMTQLPLVVAPDLPLNQAVTLMLSKAISCLPVVQNGRLCGIITTSDLLAALQSSLDLLERFAHELRDDSTVDALPDEHLADELDEVEVELALSASA